MTIRQPFSPQYGSNQVLTAGAASATAQINFQCKQVRIVNSGLNIAYVRTSSGTAVPATIADLAVIPGQTAIITLGTDHNNLAYISATGTTLQVMTGEGFS